MKRTIATLLAVLLLAGCLAPALAAEEPAPEASLYDQYGAWGEWTQEQKDAADSWTEDQWLEYWDDYYDWAWLPMQAYWSDYDAWEYEYYYEDGSVQDSWAEYIRQQKVEMGMPYPDGVNVSYNGEYLDFGAAKPLAVSGRTLVPVRAFLEKLGAKVDYKDGKITAKLENGDTVSMALDSTKVEAVRGDKINTVDMGMTPYVTGGVTYIPARFAAEALGLGVYWDDTYQAVHLTDWDALVAELDGHFSCYNELLAAAMAAVDRTKTYATNGSVSLSGTLYGEKENDTAKIAMSASGLQNSTGASADLKLDVDLGGLRETIFSLFPEEFMDLVDTMDESTYSLIVNAGTGALYFKGNHLAELQSARMPNDTWIGTNLGGEAAEYLQMLLGGRAEDMTLGSIIADQQHMESAYYYRLSPWETAMDTAQPFLLVLDDANFTKTTSGSTANYAVKLDMVTLGKRAAELGMLDDFSFTDYLTGNTQIPTVDLKLTAAVQSGKLTSLSCKGSVKLTGPVPVEITMDVSGTPLSMKGSFAFKGAYVGKIEMAASSSATVTTRTVPTAPPAGEKVVDYAVAMGYREPGVPAGFGADHYVQCALDALYFGKYDQAYLDAVGMTRAEAQAKYEAWLKGQAEYFGYWTDIYNMDDALTAEVTGLLQEIYAKAGCEVGEAAARTGGYEVKVTVTPTDVLARVYESLDAAAEDFSAQYGGDAIYDMTDEEYAAYDAAWAKLVLEQCREKLASAGALDDVEVTVAVTLGADGTLGLGVSDLYKVAGNLAPYYLPEDGSAVPAA